MDLGRAVKRALAVLAGIGLIVAVILFLAQDQVVLRVRSALAVDDPRHPDYIATLVGAPLSRGNVFDVLTNGDEIFPAMLGAIDGARTRIDFETYIYDTGEIAERFTAALENAARRGVTVTILLDAVGAVPMEAAHQQRLKAAGCHVFFFNPPRGLTLEAVNYRTHRKILVIDGEVAFTGGVGVADHWRGDAQDRDHWRDTQVRMSGPIVLQLEAAFYENVMEAGADPFAPELNLARPPAAGGAPALALRSSYVGGSSDLKRLYLLALGSARRTVDIASPYFVPDESMVWAIADAAGRGVTIRLLVEGEITDAMPVKYASRAVYERLLALGVQISEYQPTMMHTKALVVDGLFSMFGSANFDNRSLELNDELNVAVWSTDVAARLLRDFEKDLKAAQRLELASWRHRSLLEKARERFWSYFGEVF